QVYLRLFRLLRMQRLYYFLNGALCLPSLFAHDWLLCRVWLVASQCVLKRIETGLPILCYDGLNACRGSLHAKSSPVVSCKQNDLGIRRYLRYLLRHIQSIHLWHGEIKNDTIGFKFANEFNGSFTVVGFTTDVPIGVLFEV